MKYWFFYFYFLAPYWVSTDSHAEDVFRQPFENIPHVFVQASAHTQRAAGLEIEIKNHLEGRAAFV